MAYTSGYLLVFGTIMTAVVLLVRDPRLAAARSDGPVALCSGGGRRGLRDRAVGNSLPESGDRTANGQVADEKSPSISATPKGYLAAAGRLHSATWSAVFFKDPVDSFFPGFIVIGLDIVALMRSVNRRARSRLTRRRRRHAPRDCGSRVSALARDAYARLRMGLPSVSADARTARCRAIWQFVPARHVSACRPRPGRARARRWRSNPAQSRLVLTFTVALIAIANAESLRAPFLVSPFTGIPRLYTLLRQRTGGGAGGSAVLSAPGGLRERRIRAQFHGALAAADERLQRLHAGVVHRGRGRVLVISRATTRSTRCVRPA